MGLIKFKGKKSGISNDAQRRDAPNFTAQFTGGKHRPNDGDAIYGVHRPGGWQAIGKTRKDRPACITDYPIKKPSYEMVFVNIPFIYDRSMNKLDFVFGKSTNKFQFHDERDITLTSFPYGIYFIKGKFYKIEIRLTETETRIDPETQRIIYTRHRYEKSILQLNNSPPPIDLSDQLDLVPRNLRTYYEDLFAGDLIADHPFIDYPYPPMGDYPSLLKEIQPLFFFCIPDRTNPRVYIRIPPEQTKGGAGEIFLEKTYLNRRNDPDLISPAYLHLARHGILAGTELNYYWLRYRYRTSKDYKTWYYIRSRSEYAQIFRNNPNYTTLYAYYYIFLTYRRTPEMGR